MKHRKSLLVLLASALLVGANGFGQIQPDNDSALNDALSAASRFESGDKGTYADALYNVGLRYIALRQWRKAEEYFRRAIDIERRLDRHLTRAEVLAGKQDPQPLLRDLNKLGYVLVQDNRPEEAIAVFNEVFEAVKKHPPGDDRNCDLATCSNQLAFALRQLGRTSEAQQIFVQAAATASGQTKASLLQNLASIYRQQGKLNEACSAMSEACSQLLDDRLRGLALCQLGEYQDLAGKSDDAIKTYDSVLRNYNPQTDANIIAKAQLQMGNYFSRRHELKQSLEHYESAVKLTAAATVGSDNSDSEAANLRAQALRNEGNVLADMDKLAEATLCHKQAMDLAQKYNLPCKVSIAEDLSTNYLIQGKAEQALDTVGAVDQTVLDPHSQDDLKLTVGRCYRAVGQYDPAIKLIQEAIRGYHSRGDRLDELDANNALASTYLELGRVDQAERLLDEAQQTFGDQQDLLRRASIDYNRGQARVIAHQFTEAIPIFESALSYLKSTDFSAMKAKINTELGLAYLFLHEYDKALACYKTASDEDKSAASIDSEWNCNLGIGKALKGLGRLDEAGTYLVKAADAVEKERSNLTRDSFKTYNLDFRRDCFSELVDVYMSQNKYLDALAVAERGKSRAFLDMLANKKRSDNDMIIGAKPEAREDLLAMLPGQAGTRSISIIGKSVLGPSVDMSAISKENVSAPDQNEIKSLVKRRASTCIEFLPVGGKLFVWIIQPDGSVNCPPASASTPELQKLIREFTRGITASASTQADIAKQNLSRQQKLQRMYALLIKPIEQWLPKEPQAVVTIIPDSYLFMVPFASLVDDKGNFFVEKHALSYAPAIGVLRGTQALASETNQLPHKFLAFGDPITPQNAFLGDLSHAKDEVMKIYKLYLASGAPALEPLVKEQATKAQFVKLTPTATEIHLATHGLVDEERPMQSSLVLAPGPNDSGRLTAAEVMRPGSLKARLVVLSACETGKGKITGDGVVGLSRAFIIAGTPSVLVSQWNVDDVMTEFQMVKFYGSYLKGANKAVALRDAQIATIRFMENTAPGTQPILDATKPRANPRYWSAFQLIGEF